jgi:hypothetical protein
LLCLSKNNSEILSILAFLSGFVLDFTSFLQGLNLGLYPLYFRLFDKKEQFKTEMSASVSVNLD